MSTVNIISGAGIGAVECKIVQHSFFLLSHRVNLELSKVECVLKSFVNALNTFPNNKLNINRLSSVISVVFYYKSSVMSGKCQEVIAKMYSI